MTIARKLSIHDRVAAVLKGERPDRLPFIDRLELWHKGLLHTGTLPNAYRDLPLTEIHRRVGMGQQKFLSPYSLRLRGTEVIVHFEGKVIHREIDPVVERFPDVDQFTPRGQVGVTTTEIITPAGRLTVVHTTLEQTLATGARAYMSKHPITTDEDYAVAAYIVERMELVPQIERLRQTEEAIGSVGYVVPTLMRIPFLQLLIDYFSTETFFFALHDSRARVDRLLDLLDAWVTESLKWVAALDVPYVQFGDNLDGMMTNPRLFRQYVLPIYQRYTDFLHGQGKVVGSHTDGNLKPLLTLLAESGLDVCESVATAPLVPYTFQEVWDAWRNGPIIWGGIPCPLLEPGTPEAELHEYVHKLLEIVGDGRIILGISDMVLPINEIGRVHWIAEMVEEHGR